MAQNVEMSPEEREKWHQIYEIARDSFRERFDRIDSLDRKAQINLLVIGIVLGFGFFKTEFISNLVTQITPRNFILFSQLLCLAISFVLFVASFTFSILGLKPRSFKAFPEISELMAKFHEKKIEDLHASMSAFFQKVIKDNDRALESKTNYLKKSLCLILIAFLLTAAFIVLAVIPKAFIC